MQSQDVRTTGLSEGSGNSLTEKLGLFSMISGSSSVLGPGSEKWEVALHFLRTVPGCRELPLAAFGPWTSPFLSLVNFFLLDSSPT